MNLLRLCGKQPPKPVTQKDRGQEDSSEDVENIEPLMVARSEGDGGGADATADAELKS